MPPMRNVRSMSQLFMGAQRTGELTRKLVLKATNLSTYFSLFLANSKGKDKFIALFQYLFEFICTCAQHSSVKEFAEAYKRQELPDMRVYYNLKESISSARKVFRLFRFFDQIKGLVKILRTSKPASFKALSVFTYGCSILYYFSDNLLWLINMLVRSGVVEKSMSKAWKYRKNTFSLCRIVAYLLILVYSLTLQYADTAQLLVILTNPQSQNNETKHMLSYLKGRRSYRFLLLETTLSLCRFVMLVKTLKLRFHQKLDPVFVGFCGLISAVLNLTKAVYQKKITVEMDKKSYVNSINSTESLKFMEDGYFGQGKECLSKQIVKKVK